MDWFGIYLAAWGTAALAAAVLSRVCLGLAPRLGFLDRPLSEAHKRHRRPVPALGGLAMSAAWAVTLAGGLCLAHWLGGRLPPDVRQALPGLWRVQPQLLWIAGGAAALTGLGFLDDRQALRAAPKFAGQLLTCALVAWAGVRVTLFHSNPWITWALTTFWLLLIVNAINFLDNMDGLAAGITAIAAFFFALVAAVRGQHFVTVFSLALCGTACGFLLLNRPPARLFMGDAGSHFLGFCLGVAGALTTYYVPGESPTLAPLLVPACVLLVPIFDLGAVVVIRTRLGLPFYVGDNRHISHRFERMGLDRARAVLLVLLLAFANGAGAVTLLWLPATGAALVFLQQAMLLAVVSLLHLSGPAESAE
jgi:UDP-GlcNAc:undecaprenyl-phosphate GlcNAc-1-phosphate transferase